MKIILSIKLVLITLLLVGCGGSDGTNTSAPLNTLIGTWIYTYPNQCIETNTFDSTDVWGETSLDEISSGTYIFVENNSGGKHKLTVNITADNGQPDCNGKSVVNIGKSVTIFVLFPSNTSMEWYINENDTSPAYVLTRQ